MTTNQKNQTTVPQLKIDTRELRYRSAAMAESEPPLITDGGETDNAEKKKAS